MQTTYALGIQIQNSKKYISRYGRTHQNVVLFCSLGISNEGFSLFHVHQNELRMTFITKHFCISKKNNDIAISLFFPIANE